MMLEIVYVAMDLLQMKKMNVFVHYQFRVKIFVEIKQVYAVLDKFLI